MRCAAPMWRDAPTALQVIGTSAAGHRFHGAVGCRRGRAHLHRRAASRGADSVVIQEDAEARGRTVVIKESAACQAVTSARPGSISRPARSLLQAGHGSMPRDIALAAAMGHGDARRCAAGRASRSSPPGTNWCCRASTPGPDQIIASSLPACWRWSRRPAAEAIDLGIARRHVRSARRAGSLRAKAADADMLVTLGGASVGEHDLVQSALCATGHGARLLARRAASGQAADARPARRA